MTGKRKVDSLPPEWDTQLGQRLRSMQGSDDDVSDPTFDALYSGVSAQCSADDKRLSGFFRSKPTSVRRLFAIIAFVVIAVLSLMMVPPVSTAAIGLRWIATSTAYAVLLLFTLVMAIRPLYIPALSVRSIWALSLLAIVATCVAAFMPATQISPTSSETFSHASACMGMGLLIGLPVYGVVRALDRGNPLGGLLAAAAAALGGNLVLQMHCPLGDATHILMGHSSVAIIFVAGLGLLHWLFAANNS